MWACREGSMSVVSNGRLQTVLDGSAIERRHFIRQAAALGLAASASTFPAAAQQMTEPHASNTGGGQNSLDQRLARYAAALKFEDLPEDVVRLAKRAILDTLG